MSIVISALFSGFYANTDLIPKALSWIQYISPIRWSFSGFMVAWVRDMTFECPNPQLEGCIPNGRAYLDRIGLNKDSYGRSIGILFAYIVFLQLLGVTVFALNKARWLSPKAGVPKEISV